MADFQYTHPDDNIAGAVTPTLSAGTQATGYGPAKLYDNDPSYPFKVDSTTFRLVWDWGSAVAPKLIALIHHNFAAGLSGVVFQMNASDSWGAPSFSQTLTVPAYHEDDFPANIYADLSVTAPSYRYGSLAVTSANTVNCALGELVIATSLRSLNGSLVLDSSVEDEDDHPIVEHHTDVGVSTIYAHGTRWRYLRGDVRQNTTNAAAVRSWNRATQGRALPCIVLPHASPDEAWFVRFAKSTLSRRYLGPGYRSSFRFEFEEVGRGLKPTPSAV
jgi:hypothetical protein